MLTFLTIALEYSIMKGAVKEGDYPYTMKAGVIYIHLNINNKQNSFNFDLTKKDLQFS